MQLIAYSAQSNDLAAPLKCRQLHVQRKHHHQRRFHLPLKNHGSGTIYKTKYLLAIGNKLRMWHSVYKTQCAEMQLIECSAQSNDLAAPLKCRQLHIQREHRLNAVFSYLWKPSFWHHLQHEVHVRYREEKHNELKCSLLSIPHKVMI